MIVLFFIPSFSFYFSIALQCNTTASSHSLLRTEVMAEVGVTGPDVTTLLLLCCEGR